MSNGTESVVRKEPCESSEGTEAGGDYELSSSTYTEEASSEKYNLSNTDELNELVKTKNPRLIKKHIDQHINKILTKHNLYDNYNSLFIFDDVESSIKRFHAERIYAELKKFEKVRDIILFVRSKGGEPESAFLISKLCNKFKENKFIVSIPAEAKSAATLLSLGADEIHMGHMSELGPIDLQVDGLPLHSISSTLNKIASIVDEYPKSARMFSDYLTNNLKINLIGYYDRISESASQYAQILLKGKYTDSDKVEAIATRFTNHYKAHAFVIDADEARDILGDDLLKDNTAIYEAGAEMLSFINLVGFLFTLLNFKYKLIIVGRNCELIEV